jgi:hypothetical protein
LNISKELWIAILGSLAVVGTLGAIFLSLAWSWIALPDITGANLALTLLGVLVGSISFTIGAIVNYVFIRRSKLPSKIVDDTSADSPIVISGYTPTISGNVVTGAQSPISLTNPVLDFQPLPDIEITSTVSDSRIIRGSWGHVDGPRIEYLARFGVIRVRALSGTVLDCQVSARVRRTHMRSEPISAAWDDYGHLNWFAEERRETFEGRYDQLEETKWAGLNMYLRNISTDILEGHESDLLVFYMIQGAQQVFLCNEGSTTVLDFLSEHQFTRFALDLTVSGRGYAQRTFRYVANVSWDRFSIESMLSNHT